MKPHYLSFFTLLALAPVTLAQESPADSPASTTVQKPDGGLLVPNQQAAQEIGERIYNTWRLSMIRGNKTAWEGATARSRQVKVRNLIVSQRGNFERDFFRDQIDNLPMLENFKYVGALAASGGKTLALTYFGRLQLGDDGKPTPCAFVLHFVMEGKNWKFDQSSFFTLQSLPKVAERLGKKDTSVLKEQDGFYPYAKVPTVPMLCPPPQLIGKIFVDCPGREVKLKINGLSQHEFYSERRADVVSGGLRRGTNTISYHFADVPRDEKTSLAIGVFVIPETEGNSPATVFEYILDADDVAENGTFSFVVSNDSIAAMNPAFKGAKPEPFRPKPLKEKPAK
ncbi:MAG: hypothetical protein R3Y56_00505 [Akkermansia sp.]